MSDERVTTQRRYPLQNCKKVAVLVFLLWSPSLLVEALSLRVEPGTRALLAMPAIVLLPVAALFCVLSLRLLFSRAQQMLGVN